VQSSPNNKTNLFQPKEVGCKKGAPASDHWAAAGQKTGRIKKDTMPKANVKLKNQTLNFKALCLDVELYKINKL
jgi:hypothetical protein